MFSSTPPPSASQSYSNLQTPDEQRVAAFRESTNFRSVTRNDPSVVEIIDTSVYSVIYVFDEALGSWEKQKQEGPLFVVRRDKAPEYALYMLNRQAVKNVLIPLVPGEMKATAVDGSTLQLSKRADLRRGIWFSEGTEAVDRFKETIIRICGEPTKRPEGVASTSTSTPTSAPGSVKPLAKTPAIPAPTVMSMPSPARRSPAPAPAAAAGGMMQMPQANDGISRLFAGLTTASNTSTPQVESGRIPAPLESRYNPSPAASATQPQYSQGPLYGSQVSQLHLQQQSQRSEPSQQPIYQHQQPVYEHDSYRSSPPQPPSQPIYQPVSALPQSASDNAFTPGQTVDDLLNSILGFGAAPAAPVPKPAPVSQPSTQTQTPASTQSPAQPLSFTQPPPVMPHPEQPYNPVTSMRVGNASFAQAAGAVSPIPPTTRPNLVYQTLEAEQSNDRSAGPSPAFPDGRSAQVNNAATLPTPVEGHAKNQSEAPLPPPNAPTEPRNHTPSSAMINGQLNVKGPMAHSVVDALGAQVQNKTISPPNQMNEVGKRMFVQDLLHLIHTDQQFVEEVWRGFIARTSGRPG